MDEARGIVIFGDVAGSRRDGAATAAWLRTVCTDLDRAYAKERAARFGFTQGDELQGLLAPGADPFRGILRTELRDDAPRMRWAVALAPIEAGRGPATERTGEAFLAARAAISRAKADRLGLVVTTDDPDANALLEDLAPLLIRLVDDLSSRQRTVARMLIVDGLRQADVAERLKVSRATVSVVAGRARAREIQQLARALRSILASTAPAFTMREAAAGAPM